MRLVSVFFGMILWVYSTPVFPKPTVGWLESVYLFSGGQQWLIESKVDSGADHSSLHATNIQGFNKQGQTWVRFKTVNDLTIEAPFFRYAHIKTKHNTLQKRWVVWLDICLNGEKRRVEMNLVNRQHYSKSLLIGRSALKGLLIDPQKTNLLTHKPCQIEGVKRAFD